MYKLINKIILLCFVLLCYTFCNAQNQTYQPADSLSHQLVEQIWQANGEIYLNKISWRSLFESDTTECISFKKKDFIKECKAYLPEADVLKMLSKQLDPIEWNENEFKNVKCVSLDKFKEIHKDTTNSKSFFFLRGPIFNDSKTYAIIGISSQYVQFANDDGMYYGSCCISLYHLEKNKWTEVIRDCVDF